MLLIYKVVLVVARSTAPEMPQVVIYQFPTWEACKVKEAELIEGMKTERKPESVTVDCRCDAQINMGSRQQTVNIASPAVYVSEAEIFKDHAGAGLLQKASFKVKLTIR